MSNKNFHILLAEDDEDDVHFFQEALKSINNNHKLTVVSNGEKAYNYIKESVSNVDFVFLDINMPKLNGMECLKSIKSFHPSNDLKIVMLSTAMSDKMVNLSYRYGANLYIQKPTNLIDLVKYLTYCLDPLKYSVIQQGFILNNELIDN